MRFENGEVVAVRRCTGMRQAKQYALVLTAMGMKSALVREGASVAIYVESSDAEEARDQIAAYDSENRRTPVAAGPIRTAPFHLEEVLVYWAVLLFFFAVTRREWLSLDWVNAGAAQAGLILHGEVWRAATALTLHVSAAHLFGNLVFGTAFAVLLSRVTGAGVAWLAMLASGVLGNGVNALIQSPAHTSIGASTAVFAGVGLLAALRQTGQPVASRFSMRDWAPLAGGITLLVFLGLTGERTDILAHILGFLCGLAIGWLISRQTIDWTQARALQWKCAGIASGVLIAAWVIAIAAAPGG